MSLFAHELIYDTDTSRSMNDLNTSSTAFGSLSSVAHPLRTSNSNSKISISISNPSLNVTSPRGMALKNNKFQHPNIWSTAPLPFRQIPNSTSSSSANNAIHSSLFSAFSTTSHEDISPRYDSIASTLSSSPTYSPFSSFSSTSSPALSPNNDNSEDFSFSRNMSMKSNEMGSRRRHSDGIPNPNNSMKFGTVHSTNNSTVNNLPNSVIIHDVNTNNTTRPELLIPEMTLIDPRTRDPERLAALLAIVLHMELSGMQPKLLSQLGIMYKQMYPHLFVKGLLKDMIEHAVNAQLLKLTGPAGQQQVHLSSKARQLSRLNQLTHIGQIASVIPALISALSNSSFMHAQSTPPQSPPVLKANKFVYGFDETQDHVIISGGHHRSSLSGSSFGNETQITLAADSHVDERTASSFDPFSPTNVLSSSANMIPEEKIFQHEKINHLKYIYHFRVHPCRAYANKQCPAENKKNSSECFEFHSMKMRRRVLRVIQYSNGWFWSYNACRCTAIEKEQKCEKGDNCRYAHNKEEIAYHPSRYKTQACAYPLDSNGVCIRFGLHCAFAHGEDDLRKPIVLQQGMPHMLIDDGYSGSVLFSKLSEPHTANITLSPDDYASFSESSWSEVKNTVAKSKIVGDNTNFSRTSPLPSGNSFTKNTLNLDQHGTYSHNGVKLSSFSNNFSSLKEHSTKSQGPLLKSVFPHSFDGDYDKWSF